MAISKANLHPCKLGIERRSLLRRETLSFSVAISDPHFAAPKLEGEEVGPTDRRAASQDDDDLPHASEWGFPSGWG